MSLPASLPGQLRAGQSHDRCVIFQDGHPVDPGRPLHILHQPKRRPIPIMGRGRVCVRAITVPLGRRDHRPCRPSSASSALFAPCRCSGFCPTGFDQRAHRVRDAAVTGVGGVLVDQRCAHRAMTHPVHQFPRSRTRTRGQVVARVSQVVEVKPGGSPAATTIADHFVWRPKFPRRSSHRARLGCRCRCSGERCAARRPVPYP